MIYKKIEKGEVVDFSYVCENRKDLLKKAGAGFCNKLELEEDGIKIVVEFEKGLYIKNCKVYESKLNRRVYINNICYLIKSFKGDFINSCLNHYKNFY